MVLKLYMTPMSPPVRAVQMCAKEMGLELELKKIDFINKEHLQPEYSNINPQKTVPTLDDNGFIIWDSHAIMGYLVNKFGKSDKLYPKDPQKRAIVDQRLHFETGTLFPTGIKIIRPILYGITNKVNEEDKNALLEHYKVIETFLESNDFVAGNILTIADFSIFSGVSSTSIVVPIDAKSFPKLAAWKKRMESLPATEANKPGIEILSTAIQSKLQG